MVESVRDHIYRVALIHFASTQVSKEQVDDI